MSGGIRGSIQSIGCATMRCALDKSYPGHFGADILLLLRERFIQRLPVAVGSVQRPTKAAPAPPTENQAAGASSGEVQLQSFQLRQNTSAPTSELSLRPVWGIALGCVDVEWLASTSSLMLMLLRLLPVCLRFMGLPGHYPRPLSFVIDTTCNNTVRTLYVYRTLKSILARW